MDFKIANEKGLMSMRLIDEMVINEVWSMEKFWSVDGYPDSKQAMYHCAKCDTGFSVIHKRVSHPFHCYADDLVRCPACGNLELAHTRNSRIGLQYRSGDSTLESVGLRLYECKYGYRLDVLGMCIRLDADGQRVLKSQTQESIKFDIVTRLTTWRGLVSGQKVTLEIGNPFDNTFFENSVLVNLGANLNTRKRVCDELTAFFRELRNAIRKKFRIVHGYDIGSLFTGAGRQSYYGKVAAPILYIATRLIFPDLKDFTKENTTQSVTPFMRSPLFGDLKTVFSNTGIPRKASDSLSGLLKLYGLPDKNMYRKILRDQPFKGLLLKACDDACEKPDMAAKLYYHYSDLIFNYLGERAIKLLNKGVPYWESKGRKKGDIVRYLCKASVNTAYDTYEMDTDLPSEFREGVDKVSLAKLHDILSKRQSFMESADYDLRVPEYLKRRVDMQIGRLKFFLPNTSYALKAIGSAMHNCVGTYAKRVFQGWCNIVAVTDDNGKVIACLEIRDGNLVQAKLACNISVRTNPEINQVVLDWCRAAGVENYTSDVCEAEQEKRAIVKVG